MQPGQSLHLFSAIWILSRIFDIRHIAGFPEHSKAFTSNAIFARNPDGGFVGALS